MLQSMKTVPLEMLKESKESSEKVKKELIYRR